MSLVGAVVFVCYKLIVHFADSGVSDLHMLVKELLLLLLDFLKLTAHPLKKVLLDFFSHFVVMVFKLFLDIHCDVTVGEHLSITEQAFLVPKIIGQFPFFNLSLLLWCENLGVEVKLLQGIHGHFLDVILFELLKKLIT